MKGISSLLGLFLLLSGGAVAAARYALGDLSLFGQAQDFLESASALYASAGVATLGLAFILFGLLPGKRNEKASATPKMATPLRTQSQREPKLARITSTEPVLTPAMAKTAPQPAPALTKAEMAAQQLSEISAATNPYSVALAYAEAQAEPDPGNARTPRDLWNLLIKLGDQARSVEDQITARVHYEQAAVIAATLAGNSSGERYRKNVLLNYVKLGDLARSTKDLVGAQAAYESVLEVGKSILAASPTDMRTQRSVLITLYRLGDLARVRGEKDLAGRLYAEGIARATAAAATDADNAQWQIDIDAGKTRQERLSK